MSRQILGLPLLICVLSQACINFAGECNTEISERKCNPEGSLQAISLMTDCGATTTPSYGIRIVLNCDNQTVGKPENTVVGSSRGMSFLWLSNDTLIIVGADTTGGYVMKNELKIPELNREIIIIQE